MENKDLEFIIEQLADTFEYLESKHNDFEDTYKIDFLNARLNINDAKIKLQNLLDVQINKTKGIKFNDNQNK